MKKAAVFILSIVFLLTACQTKDPNAISLETVLAAFEKQSVPLKESKTKDFIFDMELNGVSPSTFELDDKLMTIYIYPSSTERENGLKDFGKKPETMNTVSFEVYEVKNVLIFYVYERDLNSEIDEKIQNVINGLNQE